jgi:hypothetical protein
MIKLKKSVLEYSYQEWREEICQSYTKAMIDDEQNNPDLLTNRLDYCAQCKKDFKVDFCIALALFDFNRGKKAMEKLKKVKS